MGDMQDNGTDLSISSSVSTASEDWSEVGDAGGLLFTVTSGWTRLQREGGSVRE